MLDIKDSYRRAEALMQGFGPRNMVPNSTVFPSWIDRSDCFWYERQIKTGNDNLYQWGREFRLVNAKNLSNIVAFDHKILAENLSEASMEKVDKYFLPITDIVFTIDSFADSASRIKFSAFGKIWSYDILNNVLESIKKNTLSKHSLISPNKKQVLFIQEHNLWVKDLGTKEERALTYDGEEFNCYAANGNGWGHDMGATAIQARWSPDSKYVYTIQRDSRNVEVLPIVEHVPKDGSIRPKVRYVKRAIRGDDNVPRYRLLVIEVESGNIQEVDYEKLPIVRNSFGFFYSGLGWWAKDSQRAYFVDMKRDYQSICVVEFDIHTGNTFILFEETSETYINTSLNTDDLPTFLSLPESNELIWFSERTDWAHCYLYDLDTGKLKNSITQGEWVVRDILYYDELRRELFLSISGRVPDRDPYYRELVRVNIDSKELTVLSSGNHDVLTVPGLHPDQHLQMAKGLYSELIYSGVSYTGNFAVVTCSRADTSPISVLLNRDGDEILTLEVADLSPLYAKVSEAWRWPEPVKLLAADKKTDTYGLVYRPSDFSPEKSYPVLSHVFNTPELSWVPKGSFTNGGSVCGAAYFTAAALAELGFIVVQIDGRGTAFRSKAFQDESYGWAASASHLEDHVAGIEQLAECYPYMDTNRVGIYALHGGPGIQALLDFPEFYKVSVCALVHDSRLMPYLWGDKFEGLPTPASNPEGTQNKTFQYPEEYMDKLQGKVLLVHGMLDISCPPAITFRLVEALQKANKDFDLLLLPCSGHSNNSYVVRRAWDYLVKNLLEIEPPKEFELTTFYDM